MFSTGGAEGITEVKMSVWFLLTGPHKSGEEASG